MRVLLNPAAGGGRAGTLAPELLKGIPDLEICTTVGPGHATALTKSAREMGQNAFLSVGGDGTLFEVVNGALSAGSGRPTIGILPLGTGNSFGRDVGVTSPEEALRALTAPKRRLVDAVKLTHTKGELWSINLVGLGFSASAGSLTNRRFKRLGALGYIAAVLVELARLAPERFRYRLDAGEWVEEDLLMLSMCNSQYTGGAMQMAPSAKIDDGRLDVIRLLPMRRAAFLTAFPKIFQGTHPSLDSVETTTAATVDLDLPGPVDVMIDGEIERVELTRLEVVPNAVEFLCLT